MKSGNVAKKYRKHSRSALIWRRFKRNKGAMAALVFLVLLFCTSLCCTFLLDIEKVIGTDVVHRLQPPGPGHPFGTDDMGRDLFWRVLYASRYSLSIGFVSTCLSLIVGVPLGTMAGYFGGRREELIMRISDIFSAIPAILMAVVIVAMLGQSTVNLMIAMGISSVPGLIKTTRAAVLTVRNEDFIEAERALGKSETYIMFRHVLPNCLSPIIVQATLRIGGAIISASSLSFLGLGIKPPTPEWGALLNAAKTYIRNSSYLALFPGLAIMLTVLAFNMLGDGLRDAMDPKLSR